MQTRTLHLAAGRAALAALLAATTLGFAGPARAANIAPEGTGILGVTGVIGQALGTPYEHAGVAGNVNDANPATVVDTWNDAGAQTHSYVGVLFPAPRTDTVRAVTLNMAAFFDGGWFGPNGQGPGASGTLTAAHLAAPTVQVTSDGGAIWETVANTNDYVARLSSTRLPVAFGPPTAAPTATFQLVSPLTGINGIRLIGTEGGQASGGFIGVFELGVDAVVPEPTSLALLGAAALLTLRRRR